MFVYANVLDDVAREKKDSLSGQMSLFDFVGMRRPNGRMKRCTRMSENTKRVIFWRSKKRCSASTSAVIRSRSRRSAGGRTFPRVTTSTSSRMRRAGFPIPCHRRRAKEIVGGIITDKKIKYTKNNKTMAFLTLEDLVGSMEIVVFPRDYERNAAMMQTDARVFIMGKVSAEDDKPSKLICEKIFPFDQVPRELWIQFADKETVREEVADLYDMLHEVRR